MLNHRFRPDANHLIVTLDVEGYDPPVTNAFPVMYRALATLFPTLSRHSCCEQWENTPLFLQSIEGVSIKSVGEAADVAHLTEHVMVDLQCAISGMKLCSGITCGHRSPENRFDVFVECTDPRVGAFSAHLATFLVAKALHLRWLSPRYRTLVTGARMVATHPQLEDDTAQLAKRMGCCLTTAQWVRTGLEAFGLITRSRNDDSADD
ncbi:MAG: hypothetical protein GF341_05470 [candidate division Zixibacteria bacterium]|nr:hypothetical protein [candidate division Zixibacteria bacterium]